MDFTQFWTVSDLVRFAALSDAHFLCHATVAGKEIYFIHVLSPIEGAVYFAEHDEAIKEKYVVYDPYKDIIFFTSKLEANPPKTIFPFLEIEVDTGFFKYLRE